MRGRYFRYLFKNLDGSLFHIGSVFDKDNQKTTNYIYMVGSYYRSSRKKKSSDLFRQEKTIPKEIDMLILGGYTLKDLNKLIYMLKKYHITTIVLPYYAPIQRLALMEETKESGAAEEDLTKFLKSPYQFLKNAGIQQIYFLYGNGTAISCNPEELEPGIHFEQADRDTLKLIGEMEGYAVPVVQAGYIVENNWLFYFGIYGVDIHLFSNFTRDYFSHIENIREMSNNVYEDYASQTERLVQEFLKKFGSSPATTITMFEGPLYDSSSENDSFMTEKEFQQPGGCRIWGGAPQDTGCMIKCLHDKDYDVMQRHRQVKKGALRFGILMLGNTNLNRYGSELVARFWQLRFRIRGICIPSCGRGEDWNHQILELSISEDRIYWVCSKHDITSVGVVSDIVLSSPNNRFVMVDEKKSCCISGYLIPREDLD